MSLRLFVAAPVPDTVRDALVPAVAAHHDDGRAAWTRPAGWHCTLAFLGDVEDDAIDPVRAAVRDGIAQAGVGALALRTGAVTTLGRGALAVEVLDEPDGALADLGEAIQQALAAVGLPVTRRPVRGHLTLGRARRKRSVPTDLVAAVVVPELRWDVADVEVVRSILGRGPAVYEPVARVPLG